jgi:hypothetical protein
MKNGLKIFFCSTLILLPTTSMSNDVNEHEAVNKVMQNFIQAYEKDDGNLMRKAFRSDGMMIGYTQSTGKVSAVSGEDFANRFEGKPGDDEAQRKRSFKILDVADNAALVKVTLDYPNWEGVDYLALTKIDGAWKIISKSYSGRAKSAPKKAVRP